MAQARQDARARFSVDLGGLKAAVMTRAAASGRTPSGVIREVLAQGLGVAVQDSGDAELQDKLPAARRVRLHLRLRSDDASALLAAARHAGLTPAAYLAALVAGVPAVVRSSAGGSRPVDMVRALLISSATLGSLARDLRLLTRLLAAGEVDAARAYRASLQGAEQAIQAHLRDAGAVLSELKPRGWMARNGGATARSDADARRNDRRSTGAGVAQRGVPPASPRAERT